MKIRINKDVIAAFNPCKGRFDNYLRHYADFDADILEFLDLDKISAQDKVWVVVRIFPKGLVKVFAIDYAVRAAYAANAANAANAATDAAAYDESIEVLKYLIKKE